MCGILFELNKKEMVNSKILTNYIKQRTRGLEGYGFAFMSSEGNMSVKRALTEESIIHKLVRCPSNMILFHHRQPTSTENVIQATHPFYIKGTNGHYYYFVHNGIIANSHEIKESHEKQFKCKYSSIVDKYKFNDSEALAIDFVLVMTGHKEKIEAKGSIAFVCVESDENKNPLKVYFGKNYVATLKMKKDEYGLHIGSEIDGVEIESHNLYSYDIQDDQTIQTHMDIPSAYSYVPHNYYNYEDRQPIGFLASGSEKEEKKSKKDNPSVIQRLTNLITQLPTKTEQELIQIMAGMKIKIDEMQKLKVLWGQERELLNMYWTCFQDIEDELLARSETCPIHINHVIANHRLEKIRREE